MKAKIKAKHFAWSAAAVTAALLVLVLLQTPMARAKYAEIVANINTALSEVTATEADNLATDLMNRMYPVGSIFMTTSADLNTEQKMKDHFGGKWVRWGQGQVPVGVDPGTAAFASLAMRSTSMGGGTRSVSLPVSLSVSGGIDLTKATAPTFDNDGKFTLNNDSTVALGGGDTYTSDGQNPVPNHNHVWKDLTVPFFNYRSGSPGTSDSTWCGDVGQSGGVNANVSVTLANTAAPTQSFTLPTILTFPRTGFGATLTNFTATLNHPTGISYQDQEAAANLTVEGDPIPVNVADTTLQPYVTCYMYIREELAPLRAN